ncbi:pilin [Francisella sp. LA112445]|uniref:pilin n=1 Tax=Francisella sp. LA112445 TaxID=1395624 RepID=UPI001788CA65|nr:pilin [Francisella sp. LA112445]QIW11074.1 prepilin-type N-terminal cleavage/methylation domain-containing protein [Francisella sp. LA112445]
MLSKFNKHKGLTLLELMVVVAIIVVLAAVFTSIYSKNTAKAEVSKALSLVSPVKHQIAEEYTSNSDFPESVSDLPHLSDDDSEVSFGYSKPDIDIRFDESNYSELKDHQIELTPVADGSLIKWGCQTDIDSDYMPLQCNHVSSLANQNGAGNSSGAGGQSVSGSQQNSSDEGDQLSDQEQPLVEGSDLYDNAIDLVKNLFTDEVGDSDVETRYSEEGTPLLDLDGDTQSLIASEDISDGEIRMFLSSELKDALLLDPSRKSEANNYIELMGADDIAIRSSYGDDTVKVDTLTNSDVATFSDSDTVEVLESSGNYYVLDPSSETLAEEPLAAYGNDKLTIGRSINDEILVGGGNDVVNINSGEGLKLSALEGNDTINLGSVNSDNITTGDGDDVINIISGNSGNLSGDISDYSNGIRSGSGNDTINVGYGSNVLNAGTGDDAVTIDWGGNNQAAAGNYDGSSGSDNLVIKAQGDALNELLNSYVSDPGLHEVTTNFSDGNTFSTRSFENIKIINSETGEEVFSGTKNPDNSWTKVY